MPFDYKKETEPVDRYSLELDLQQVCGTGDLTWRDATHGQSDCASYQVDGKDGTVFIKLAETDAGITRLKREASVLQQWGGSPALTLLSSGQGYLITEHLSGGHLPIWTVDDMKAVQPILAQVATGPQIGGLDEQQILTDEHVAHLSELPDDVQKTAKHFIDKIWPLREVACHGDTHRNNWMSTPDGLRLVDWELSSGGPQGWDQTWIVCDLIEIPIEDRLEFLLNEVDEKRAVALISGFYLKANLSRTRPGARRSQEGNRWYLAAQELWKALQS